MHSIGAYCFDFCVLPIPTPCIFLCPYFSCCSAICYSSYPSTLCCSLCLLLSISSNLSLPSPCLRCFAWFLHPCLLPACSSFRFPVFISGNEHVVSRM